MYTIADLHCDLLLYLAEKETRTPYDQIARCSIPQLRQGNVQLQTLAIFTETNSHSVDFGLKQSEIFSKLLKDYSNEFQAWSSSVDPQNDKIRPIRVIPAIENASGFCSETEPFEDGINRLNQMIKLIGKPLYITMTWNTENRFGGGAHTSIGLNPDGRKLLDVLAGQKIAVDMSHTSDQMAWDILNYIDKHNLDIPVIASHSNFRVVSDFARNLPDDIAREILDREGIIGLNFVRSFVGREDPINFVRHLEHGLKLGAKEQLCFGADFFYEEDLSAPYRKASDEHFFPEFGNSSVYSKVIDLWKCEALLAEEDIHKIAEKNLLKFLNKIRVTDLMNN